MKNRIIALTFAFSLVLAAAAAPPDVSGKWRWIYERNGESLNIEMLLKQEGSKLTGKIVAPEVQDMEIRDGKVSDEGVVGFYVNLERDNGALKITFSGKADGNSIKGKTSYKTDDGETKERDWNPKRDVSRNLSGKWNSTFKRSDGTAMETVLQFKQEADKLTGTQAFNDNEAAIKDGKIDGDDVRFRIERDRDGRTVTSKYKGKVQKDGSIKGEIESDWTGEVRKLDWEARPAKD